MQWSRDIVAKLQALTDWNKFPTATVEKNIFIQSFTSNNFSEKPANKQFGNLEFVKIKKLTKIIFPVPV